MGHSAFGQPPLHVAGGSEPTNVIVSPSIHDEDMTDILPRAFRPQSLEEYVACYGEVSRHIQYDYRPRTTTKGAVARPEHRLAPEIIRPWSSFDVEQDILWNAVVDAMSRGSVMLPSQDHIVETGKELALIDCEAAVHLCDTDLIHKPVSRILHFINTNPKIHSTTSRLISRALGTGPLEKGHNFFSTHRNQLNDIIPQIAGSKRKFNNDAIADSADTGKQPGQQEHEGGAVLHLHMSREAVEQHFRAGPTDGFCNFKGDAEARRILFAYELKAPHKLPWQTIHKSGLAKNNRVFHVKQDIWRRQDDEGAGKVSDNDDSGNRATEHTRHDEEVDSDPLFVTAGVITQLYDFMIRERLQYGYISTSDCYMFLHVDPDSPTTVEYYTVRRPQPDDVLPSIRMLPLARVMLLALLSLARGGAIPGDAATRVEEKENRWPVIRRAMTETTESASLTHSIGRESTADKSFRQSTVSNTSGSTSDHTVPDGLQAGFSVTNKPSKRKHDDGYGLLGADGKAWDRGRDQNLDKDGERLNKCLKTTDIRSEASAAAWLPSPPALPHSPPPALPPRSTVKLNDVNDPEVFRRAPACTARCIFGIVCGGLPDMNCPNRGSHPAQHPSASGFRELLRHQLADDPFNHTLWVGWSGSTATIFKIRLASLGYVLIAKASSNKVALRTEERNYRRYLVPAQESGAVPPCLGLLDLPEPWPDPDVYADRPRHDLTCCLLLGWVPGRHPRDALRSSVAGSIYQPLLSLSPSQKDQKEQAKAALRVSVRAAFEYIHGLGLRHGDAALRNLRVESSQPEGPFRTVLFDFEAAEPCDIWWERLQRKWRRRRQCIPTDEKEVLFQAACEREITQCLDDIDML